MFDSHCTKVYQLYPCNVANMRSNKVAMSALLLAGAGLEKGTYLASLVIYSNDPEQPITHLPLELEIS